MFALVCIVLKVPRVENPNRAGAFPSYPSSSLSPQHPIHSTFPNVSTKHTTHTGFLALAQLPPVFLFASKNSPLTALLLGPGVDYTKLNR
jgi:hypothetical protein